MEKTESEMLYEEMAADASGYSEAKLAKRMDDVPGPTQQNLVTKKVKRPMTPSGVTVKVLFQKTKETKEIAIF